MGCSRGLAAASPPANRFLRVALQTTASMRQGENNRPRSPTDSTTSSSRELGAIALNTPQERSVPDGGAFDGGPSMAAAAQSAEFVARLKKKRSISALLGRSFSAGKTRASPVAAASPWEPLFDAGQEEKVSHEALLAAERQKKWLLGVVRGDSPMDTIYRLRLLPRTVLPRLLRHPLCWLVPIIFCASATVRRLDLVPASVLGPPDFDEAVFDGASTSVTFMIIFYVGCMCCSPSLDILP